MAERQRVLRVESRGKNPEGFGVTPHVTEVSLNGTKGRSRRSLVRDREVLSGLAQALEPSEIITKATVVTTSREKQQEKQINRFALETHIERERKRQYLERAQPLVKAVKIARKKASQLETNHHKRKRKAKAEHRVRWYYKNLTMRLMYLKDDRNKAIVDSFDEEKNRSRTIRRLLLDTSHRHMYPDQTPDERPAEFGNWLMLVPDIGTVYDDLMALGAVAKKIFTGRGNWKELQARGIAAVTTDVVAGAIGTVTFPLNVIPGMGSAIYLAVNTVAGLGMRTVLNPDTIKHAAERVQDERDLQTVLALSEYLSIDNGAKDTLQQHIARCIYDVFIDGRNSQQRTTITINNQQYGFRSDSLIATVQDRLNRAPIGTTEGTEGNKAQWEVAASYAQLYKELFQNAMAIVHPANV